MRRRSKREKNESGAGRRPRGYFARRILTLIASLSLTLLATEFVVRVALPQQLIVIRSDIWMPDDTYGHATRPNLDTRINLGEREILLRTDGNGFRVGTSPPADPRYRVLALGDSFLAALQVDHEQIMTSLVDRAVSRELGGAVLTTNTGLDGTNPNHYLIRARSELAREAYDLVVVFIYLGNDVVEERVDRYPPRDPTTRHALRLPRRLAAREVINALLYPVNDILEERSHAYILFKDRARVPLARLGLTAYYLPSAIRRTYAASPAWQTTASILDEIDTQAARHGAACLFVLLPSKFQVDEVDLERHLAAFGVDRDEIDVGQPARILQRLLSERGLDVLDATVALQEASREADIELYGRIDTHLSPDGHRVVAEILGPPVRGRLAARD